MRGARAAVLQQLRLGAQHASRSCALWGGGRSAGGNLRINRAQKCGIIGAFASLWEGPSFFALEALDLGDEPAVVFGILLKLGAVVRCVGFILSSVRVRHVASLVYDN